MQAEAEVPGTPEQVWEAIATGHGISSWFVPTEVEERKGGRVVSHFSPDGTMDAVATITEWNPPRRMVATGEDEPGGPAIATEWTVEARAGGTCTARVVHSWFASTDDWDKQFEMHELGWATFFKILRLYLERFAGRQSASFQVMGTSSEQADLAWRALLGALGIAPTVEGQPVEAGPAAPPLAGRIVHLDPDPYHEVMLLVDAPGPGIAHMFPMPMGDTTCLFVRLFFYGDASASMAAREESRWKEWIAGLTETVTRGD